MHATRPDAVEQAVHAAHLVPTDADQADVDRAREWERRVREDQQARTIAELDRLGLEYSVLVAQTVHVEPSW